MLLRNLNPPSMCNGTRLLIKELKDNLIVATIITGPASGQLAHIPRIPMIPTDLPIPFKRLQFPVKTSFALTINKSQGQTFELVGIDLRKKCFTHGQLSNIVPDHHMSPNTREDQSNELKHGITAVSHQRVSSLETIRRTACRRRGVRNTITTHAVILRDALAPSAGTH
ncbi:hypothetical protein EVAR_23205_1 [Eumeta japonica]|uniref:DNA helicase n=1 Tax=Eumeta variegata TaxID=151549 RepID=A0A4C1VE73_EUMVA|nr:hypothetical protein EVAR_23205_1 [Eumeta japonica]